MGANGTGNSLRRLLGASEWKAHQNKVGSNITTRCNDAAIGDSYLVRDWHTLFRRDCGKLLNLGSGPDARMR
jgi:hypothetical protein